MVLYPEAYREYLIYFHGERDYFECHEVLEEHWKKHPEDPCSLTYVGLIQIAVGMYHYRRGNLTGAVKMLRSACNRLIAHQVDQLGLDGVLLRTRIEGVLERIHANCESYEDIDLPIHDSELLDFCMEACSRRGAEWGSPSELGRDSLIHKHTLRDRSEVIQERLKQREIKQRNKGVLG